MASVAPSAGNYLVDATAAGAKFGSGFFRCHVVDHSFFGGNFSPTPYGYNNAANTFLTMATTGKVFGSSFSPIQERCFTTASFGATVSDAGLTAIRVDSVNGAAAVKPAKKNRPLANKFVPKAVRGGHKTAGSARPKG